MAEICYCGEELVNSVSRSTYTEKNAYVPNNVNVTFAALRNPQSMKLAISGACITSNVKWKKSLLRMFNTSYCCFSMPQFLAGQNNIPKCKMNKVTSYRNTGKQYETSCQEWKKEKSVYILQMVISYVIAEAACNNTIMMETHDLHCLYQDWERLHANTAGDTV